MEDSGSEADLTFETPIVNKVKAKRGRPSKTKRPDCISLSQTEVKALAVDDDNPVLRAINALNEKMSHQLNNLDMKLSGQIARLQDEVLSRVNAIEETQSNLEARVSVIENSSSADKTLNVVIKNLPERANEIPEESVNVLIKDGLKKDVVCVSAELKLSHNSHPGVIIAKFKDPVDKSSVMNNKSSLKDSQIYKKVYIEHDKSRDQRLNEANIKALVKGLKDGKPRDFIVKGSRVYMRDNQSNVPESIRPTASNVTGSE